MEGLSHTSCLHRWSNLLIFCFDTITWFCITDKKSKFSLFGKNKKANLDLSEEEDDEDDEPEEKSVTKAKKGMAVAY